MARRRKQKGGDHKAQGILINLSILLASLVVAVILGEVLMRAFTTNPIMGNERYGWRWENPRTIHREVRDDVNVTRQITVNYTSHGFKRWGDVNTTAPKAFIVGDSFTEMRYVNNGEEWYSYLERAYPRAEFFVYGAGGFGSLQEFFIIDDYIDTIEPDMILVQMHYNDFINNDYRTDRKEYPMSNQVARPYLEDGEIVMRVPLTFPALRKHSRLFSYAMRYYDIWLREQILKHKDEYYNGKYGEDCWKGNFTTCGIFDGRFDEELNTTKQIYAMMSERAGDTPVYFFNVDTRAKQAEKEIADYANITYIEGVSDYVFRHHDNGTNTQIINDGHWNRKGNELAGKYLVNYFNEHEVLPEDAQE